MTKLNARNRQTKKRSGFTLIEVLLVLIILAIIAGMATTQFGGVREQANIDSVKSQIGLVKSAIELYELRFNQYPSQIEDLWEKPSDSTIADKWTEPYLEKLPADPWGNEYVYEQEGKQNAGKYDFWSKGPDGKSGTDDDIGNWEKES